MLFWIVVGTLAALVAALLARPLLRSGAAPAGPSPDQAIYRDQLAEVERDLARGVLAPEEAERARTEIARRLLAADRVGPAPLSEAPRSAALAAVALAAAVVVMGSLMVYSALGRPGAPDLPRAQRLAEAQALRESRPSQAEAEAQAARVFPAPEPDVPADYLAMVEQLREIVPTRPDDLEGWKLLALHEARLGRYAASAQAQAHVVELKGVDATVADYLDWADRMVAAAGGIVTPETEAILSEIEGREPGNLGLLYYLGLLEAQTGRPDLTFPLWREVVERAPSESLHRRLASSQIEEVAWAAGVEYVPPDAAGPTQDEVAAAQEMSPEARQEMIQGMVEGLRSRLAAEGGPAQDWGQLVTALSVLGDGPGAQEALAQGRAAHEGDAEALAILDAAARQAGLQ